MERDQTRNHIEEAHRGYEALHNRANSPTGGSAASPGDYVDASIVEVLHHLVHAVDEIETRVTRLDGPMFPKLNERISPIVRRNSERVRGVLHRTRTAIGSKLPGFRREQPAPGGASLQIGYEVAELRNEVRSLREAMEALARKN